MTRAPVGWRVGRATGGALARVAAVLCTDGWRAKAAYTGVPTRDCVCVALLGSTPVTISEPSSASTKRSRLGDDGCDAMRCAAGGARGTCVSGTAWRSSIDARFESHASAGAAGTTGRAGSFHAAGRDSSAVLDDASDVSARLSGVALVGHEATASEPPIASSESSSSAISRINLRMSDSS